MDYLTKRALKNQRAREKAPKPIEGPKAAPPPPPPPPAADTSKVEAMVGASHEILAGLLKDLANGRRNFSSVTVKINTRDGSGNIKTLTVTPV